MVSFEIDTPVTQTVFAGMVGVTQPAVSRLLSDGVLPQGGTAQQWLHAYCERLREQAAGRAGSEVGGLDLVQERAGLAREQRIAQAMKNAIARGEYAPIGLLADVLAMASSAVVDRFEQLEGSLRKTCPDLPDEARLTVMTVIAGARNEWIRSTEKLVVARLEEMVEDDDSEDEAEEDS